MNVITVKDTDFLRPNSPDNKKAISKQIKIIRELYKVFPYAVVAGGCPVNHLLGVPGRDIDIFVTSETEAEQIVQYFTANLTPEQSCIQQFSFSKPDDKYIDNFNSQCWKFFGASQQPRNPGLFDMNVIVRKIPAETQVLHRIQLLPLLWATFPIPRMAHAYLDHGGLWIMIASGGGSVGTPDYVGKMFHKNLMFALAQREANGKTMGRTFRIAEFFRGDLREARVGPVPFPGGTTLNKLFTRTSDLINDLYRGAYKVSDRNIILETIYDFQPTRGWGRCMSDGELLQVLTGERTVEDVHQEIADKGRAVRAKHPSPDKGYLSDLSWYNWYQRSSARPRSQDWADTWGTPQAVQPSGGQDTVVDSTSSSEGPNPFSGTNVVQRNISLSDLERIRTSFYSREAASLAAIDVASATRSVSFTTSSPSFTTQFGGTIPPGTWEAS